MTWKPAALAAFFFSTLAALAAPYVVPIDELEIEGKIDELRTAMLRSASGWNLLTVRSESEVYLGVSGKMVVENGVQIALRAEGDQVVEGWIDLPFNPSGLPGDWRNGDQPPAPMPMPAGGPNAEPIPDLQAPEFKPVPGGGAEEDNAEIEEAGEVPAPEPTELQTSYRFHFDPAKAKPSTEEAFNEIRASHYQMLAVENRPGRIVFRQLAEVKPDPDRPERNRENDLDRSFSFFSGSRAVAENLSLDRDLIGEVEGGKMVPLKDIEGVTVKPIDWSGRLPAGEIVLDPLALAIPEDQHVLFAPSLKTLLSLMEKLETKFAPMGSAFTTQNPYADLATRYRRQLGMDLPDFTAALLPVKSVAVTGGDPFFPSGTDVAIVMESASPDALLATLETAIGLRAKTAGATKDGEGFRTPDRAFSSYLAKIGKAVVVTNSPAQLARLRAVADGKSPALGATDEFRFFRHRYPLTADDDSVFAFLSDAAIRRWAGPETRIAASRRNRATAALQILTAEKVAGKPASGDFDAFLGNVGLLDGLTSTRFGSLSFMTPISEMALTEVTQKEKEAYERWRRGYESGWRAVFDPIALRLRTGETYPDFDLTVMPLTAGSDYADMIEIVGDSQLSAKSREVPPKSLLHFAMALDKESAPFRQMDQSAVDFLPDLKIKPFSWLGDSMSLTIEDRFFWRAMVVSGSSGFTSYFKLPVLLRVETDSVMKRALFLAALKVSVMSSSPGSMNWENRKSEAGTYVAVETEEGPEGVIGIYYATLQKSLLLSLDEEVLQNAMAREKNPAPENPPAETPNQAYLKTNVGFLGDAAKMLGDDLQNVRREKSWAALPILNLWHRQFPDKDTAELHRAAFGVGIVCPGGKGYRWNEKALTMESVAYGFPAEPRDEGEKLGFLETARSLESSMSFEEDGLRLVFSSRPEKKKEAAAEPKQPDGPVLATAEELTFQKEGVTAHFQWTDGEEKGTIEITITAAPSEDGGKTLTETTTWKEDSGLQTSVSTFRLHEGLHHLTKTVSGHKTVFSPPMLILPANLIQGQTTREESQWTDEGGLSIVEVQLTVVGLETVKVPAGEFKDCVKIESVQRSVRNVFGGADKREQTLWWHPEAGLVKSLSTKGRPFTYELVKVE